MSAGHIRRRGRQSWELKFDAGREVPSQIVLEFGTAVSPAA